VAFQGDVAQIPLSNILQALLLNGQEGVLTMEIGSLKRRIKVLKRGLRPLNYDKESPDLLKLVLLKQRILTEAQFQNTFSTWVAECSFPGDFLISRRILTQDTVRRELRRQLENVILEVLVTQKLKYEFTAEDDGTSYELFSPDGLGEDLVFNSNAILMEMMRREDEWRRFRAEIPAATEIYVAADRAALSSKDVIISPHALKELKPALTGENTVERLISLTTLSAFEVYEALFHLKQQKIIRTLNLEEKKTLADKLKRSLRTDDAAEIYKSILRTDPSDRETRQRLVTILEKSKNQEPELIENYLAIASSFWENDLGECKSYLEKVLAISPFEIRALEMLFDLHQANDKHKEAISVARSVIAAARSNRDGAKAVDLLYRIVNFYPEESLLFHELAEIHLEAHNTDAALECLKTVAEIYERRKDLTKLRKTYERITRLRPSEAHKLRRVVDLERRKKSTPRRFIKFVSLNLACGALLTLLFFVGVSEYYSRMLYAQVLADVNTQTRGGHLAKAKATLEDFEKVFPYSSLGYSVHDQLTEVSHLLLTHDEDVKNNLDRRRMEVESDLTRARIAINDNDYLKSQELLARVDPELLKADQAQEARTLRSTINKYFEEASELLKLAEVADKNQDLALSHRLRSEILRNYPYSRAARDLLFPIQVDTLPPGADLIVDGRLVAQTPTVIRISAVKVPSVLLSKKGYNSFYLNKQPISGVFFNPLASHIVSVPLNKNVEWKFDAKSSIEGVPLVVADNICFGTRNGEIFCVNQENSSVVWSFTIPGNMDFAGGCGLWNNMVYFGSFDGKVYVLDSQTGKLLFSPSPACPELHPIKHAPSQASEKGLVALNCDKKLLSTFSLATGKPSWSMEFPSSQLLGSPQAFQGSLYLCTSNGELLEVAQDSGEVTRRISLATQLHTRGRMAKGRYFVGNVQGKVLAVDLKDGRIVWSYDCGEQATTSPIIDGESVIVSTQRGKLFCFSLSGDLKWIRDTGDAISQEMEGVVFRNYCYIGTKRGYVLCTDIWSGQPIWQFTTAGFFEKEQRGILASGAISKGRLFIGSEDHFFYCFSLD
jgi:outer membrane protein assembly factor BamB/tetratricopeptide (TPR) repeat protein